ncbi:MAG: HD domain-containing phosphohydrolase [Pseudomonadota bacterium]
MEEYDDPLLARLEELNRIGAALSSEKNIHRLLETILVAAKRITRADAGTLYLVDNENQELHFEIVLNDTLGITPGGGTAERSAFAPVPLFDEEGAPNHTMVVAHAALSGKTVNIPDAYIAAGYDFSGTKEFDQKSGYRSQSFLTVPMRDHENQVIGVLQLINAKSEETGGTTRFSAQNQRLVESLASQAAIALTNRKLVQQLEELFESFVNLINTAIDDKSPYTGRHCERVPDLTMMLAEAVSRTDTGPFARFSMSDKDRYELKIASMLHDCGKVATPVYVVDKATKLQTIFDRIALIDTRFEVVKRDAEIEMLRGELASRAESRRAVQWQERFEVRLREIEEDRAFLHTVNIGSERMSDEAVERVRQIALRYRWRDAQGAEQPFLSDNEIENLTVRAGTLTAAEREIINRHIDTTIKMLESLPWPQHLKNVPEYAGGHHERMDGKGYPRGLSREQMSVQARMMGIADIFEALTARDRPYKKGKTLSESLNILGKFKLNGHVDPDLFDIFVRQGVYLEYARRFLSPEQIDEVDLTQIPGYTP